MARPTLARAALFTPLGLLALFTVFAGATTAFVSAGATPEAAGLFGLVVLMGTGEAVLHVLDRTIHRALDAPARRRGVAKAHAHAHAQDGDA